MSLRNITLPQALIVIALLAATVVTYKLFGEVPAVIAIVLQTIVAFLMGRDPAPPELTDGGAK